MTRAVAVLFLLQLGLLTIGITRDYQLKHEDNNALHATFARSHVYLGLSTTRGQNYFYSPADGNGTFYPNHPPGPALLLALVYTITGLDGPAITRGVAIAVHMVAALLFLGLARRVLETPREAAAALLLFIVLPESAFFGRMVNHEVLALPGALLLVRGYWEAIQGGWERGRWIPAVLGGAAWAALSGWVGFFAIGACAGHAAIEAFLRGNRRARMPFLVLTVTGATLFGLAIAHLVWILGGEIGYLRALFTSRAVGEGGFELFPWIGRILELHWRYFGLTSALGLAVVAVRAIGIRSAARADAAQQVALIFLLAGAGYVAAFAVNATVHDYWQFLLLPASSLGIVLLLRRVLAWTVNRTVLRRVLVGLIIVEIAIVTGVTLVRRHVKQEGYCLKVVAEMRRNVL